MDDKLNSLFTTLIQVLLKDLKSDDRRKDAYPTAVAILKQMDFGIMVKPNTPAASLRQALPFQTKKAN